MKHLPPRRAASGAVLAMALVAPWAMPAQAQSTPAPAASSAAAAAAPGPQQFTLANGMTLIVQPDRRSPTAVQMVWVRVGSLDEVDGTSGVAHALEHMMFKGTRDIKPGEFSRRVAALGGQENAFTTRDYTGYYQQIPVGSLEQVMKLESDRFANNQWPDDEFKREIEVVKEERRLRTEDQPRALLGEQQNAAVFIASPYHRPVVGWMSDLDAMTPADVRDFHQRWYVPANAVLVVAGDVDVAQVRAMAEKYYGRIPSRAVPVRKPRVEPVQRGIRRLEFKAPAEQAYVSLAYRVPQIANIDDVNSDSWALVVLSAVLDGYAGARLDRALTQGPDRVADSAGAYAGFIGRGPQLFVLEGVPAAGKSAEAVEAALRAQVARIAKEGVGEAELARVKTQWVASETYKRDSVMAQARELGSNWIQGLPLDASERIVARLQAVTAAQVQAVAAKYFGDDQLTVATLRPLPPEAKRGRGFAAPAGELR
ncbi:MULTISPECIES: M16 family metallopeptidase [unclassified Variovorax]|uniref:M16 family metallopeptidase n=1 Tax=unclassified Variovorax TaxID=663243 RepID=UPI000D12410D|nr:MULTISPECIES: pitrilysin family protein [unclassified Variovorax]AVQ83743.1 peptidase M16 [Variovorax sp. PMC12]QRY31935.1 insulinase family protein [Variovorax sp. PDNC026]